MFRRILLAGTFAGLLTGLVISIIQLGTTSPLIMDAEQFEGATSSASMHSDDAIWETTSLERLGFTMLANALLGVGFGLLLCGAFALHGRPVVSRDGVIWGAAGFAVFTLAPALGMPAELPGTATADLAARQLWWLWAVAAAAVGLWMLVFAKARIPKLLGVGIALFPHVMGAPRPEQLDSAVPAQLASEFAASSIVVSAVFWLFLGWISARLFGHVDGSVEPRQHGSLSPTN